MGSNMATVIWFMLIALEPMAQSASVMDTINNVNENADGDTHEARDENDNPLFELDIVEDNNLRALLTKTDENVAHDARIDLKWPDAVVPYTIHNTLNSKARNAIEEAIAHLHERVCVRFKPRQQETSYVEFFRGYGCYSHVGRQGRKQLISLGLGCETKGIVLHEMLHAIGFFHEHSRLDRDKYIKIIYENIIEDKKRHFGKYQVNQATTHGAKYDKKSIMHYGNYAFSKNKQKTIESRSDDSEELGQRLELSEIDAQQVNAHYCPNGTTATQAPTQPPTEPPCVDNVSFCYRFRWWCNSALIRYNCKKTCNNCACQDANPYCPRWAQFYCNMWRYKQYMAATCPKSCGHCT